MSLVVQWLRICLPMQGDMSLIPGLESPHVMGQLSLRATSTEAHALQWEKPLQWEPTHYNYRLALARHSERKPAHSKEGLAQPKMNTKKIVTATFHY